jgi:hypothetical protein
MRPDIYAAPTSLDRVTNKPQNIRFHEADIVKSIRCGRGQERNAKQGTADRFGQQPLGGA